MTPNQNLRSTKHFAVIGYTGSKRSRAICCFLTRNEIITGNEKKVNILITFHFTSQLFDLRAACRGNNEVFLVPWNKTLKYLNYFLLGFYSKV